MVFPVFTNQGAIGGAPAITVIDDGDYSQSGSSDPFTFTATSTGPVTVVVVTYSNASFSARTISGVTFDGNAMDELVQHNSTVTQTVGSGIYIIDGAQSGTVSVNMSGTTNDGHITVLSLENLQSTTAVDTDEDYHATSTTTLSALTNPGSGGVVIVGYSNGEDTSAITFTNATELDDLDAGTMRHGVAYVLGNPAGNISADGGTNDGVLVAASLR